MPRWKGKALARVKLNNFGTVVCRDNDVLLHSDVATTLLEGASISKFVKHVIHLCDGSLTIEQVAALMPSETRSSVFTLIDLFQKHGLLTIDTDVSVPSEDIQWQGQDLFFQSCTKDHVDRSASLRNSCILILGLEPWGVVFANEVAASGVKRLHIVDDDRVSHDDLLRVRVWNKDFLNRYRRDAIREVIEKNSPWCEVTTSPDLRKANLPFDETEMKWDLASIAVPNDDAVNQLGYCRFTHSIGVPYICGSLRGLEYFLGPIVIPKETPCWNCCRLRLLANDPCAEAKLEIWNALKDQPIRPCRPISLAPMSAILGGVLAGEAIKFLTNYAPTRLKGCLLIQNSLTLETTQHNVITLPWCEICGGAADKDERRINCKNRDELESLLRILQNWVDPRSGVISYLGLRASEPSEPMSPICAQAVLSSYINDGCKPMELEGCGGKGLSSVEAMVGAACEAIERYSASRCRSADLTRSLLYELEGDKLDPRQLSLYSDTQYKRVDFPYTPFNENHHHLWTRGMWLDNAQPVWLPAQLTYYNSSFSESDDNFCQVTSNGLAAGSTFEDACVRATLELVERDAFMLSWFCRLPGRRLILDATVDVRIQKIMEELRVAGAMVELYQLDVGIPIPTVVCLAFGDGRNWPGVTVSSAADLNIMGAARKAIMEQCYSGIYLRRVMQKGTYRIPGRPDDVRRGSFMDHAMFYVPPERSVACNFLREGEDPPILLASQGAPCETNLELCLKRLAVAGIRIAVADVTSPDVMRSPLRVVRALGSTLQPLHCGFGLERLDNPRLKRLLKDSLNTDIHPLC